MTLLASAPSAPPELFWPQVCLPISKNTVTGQGFGGYGVQLQAHTLVGFELLFFTVVAGLERCHR